MKSGENTGEEERIRRHLLAYLFRHPHAQDTFEGIVQWWLPDSDLQSRRLNVRAVVAELVGDGLLLEQKGVDSTTSYRLNPDRRGEVQEVLGQEPPHSHENRQT